MRRGFGREGGDVADPCDIYFQPSGISQVVIVLLAPVVRGKDLSRSAQFVVCCGVPGIQLGELVVDLFDEVGGIGRSIEGERIVEVVVGHREFLSGVSAGA